MQPRLGIESAPEGLLVTADGAVFRGRSVGAEGVTTGEVVFNTSMTGYQEILTDPSYAGQVVTMTTSHIGNYGVNAFDAQADRPMACRFHHAVTVAASLELALGGVARRLSPPSRDRGAE